MIKEIPIKMISDFPVISREYKRNFSGIDSHLVIGARIIDKQLINELAGSIAREGLHHPVTVRSYGNGYQMISGHLRKYAFKKLSRDVIPAKMAEVDTATAKTMLITSNHVQRPLDPIEESWIIADLADKENKSYGEIARDTGVSRSYVYNRHMLSKRLREEVQIDILMGLIPKSIAREIATVPAREQLELAKSIKRHRLSYRQSYELTGIIKDTSRSVRIKNLALDDPRAVISKLSNKDEIIQKNDNGLSYFANNFKEETDRLNCVALELLHRLRRDYRQFAGREKDIVDKSLLCAYKRIGQLKKSIEDYGVWQKI